MAGTGGGAGAADAAVTVRWLRTADDGRPAAHALLLRTVAEVAGSACAAIRVEHAPSGQPWVVGAEGLQVSVSRTRGAVAVAVVAGAPIGVDLEAPRPMPALRLARRWLTEAEHRWIGSLHDSDQVEGFLWLWTQKEAIGKARGLGLRDGGIRQPIALPERWPPQTGAAGRVPWQAVAGIPDLMSAAWSLPAGLVLAVACGRTASGLPTDWSACEAARDGRRRSATSVGAVRPGGPDSRPPLVL